MYLLYDGISAVKMYIILNLWSKDIIDIIVQVVPPILDDF